MKPGDLLRIIHRIALADDAHLDDSLWKLGIYLGHVNFHISGETLKVFDSDGKVNYYPTDSFYFEVVE